MTTRNIVSLLGAALIVASLNTSAFAQSSTAGAVNGQVKDQDGTGLPGVTIVATSPALQGQQSAISSGNGTFKLTNLPAGIYVVQFYFGDSTIKRANVDVRINKTTSVYVKFDTSKSSETIVIDDVGVEIDTTSAKQGVTLGQDYTQNIPVPGRTFESALGAAAGSQGDALGVSFSGSSSLENSYVVDGINTTGLTFGTVGSPVINDFIKEIEIITGGYQAEHGRSTGGVVNVVTKTGTNEFHGTVFSYFSNDFIAADTKDSFTAQSAIDAESETVYDLNFGFDLGGPIIKDKLWFYVGFAPRLIGVDNIQINKRQTDCRSIGADGSLSIAADAPCTPGAVMADGDTIPDVDPDTGFIIFEELSRRSDRANQQEYNFVSKLNYSLSPEHQGQLTFSGAPVNNEVRGIGGDPVALTRQTSIVNTDIAVKWTSKFNDAKTEVEFVGGFHRSKATRKAANPLGDQLPLEALLFSGSNQAAANLGVWSGLGFEDMATVRGCSDTAGADDYPGMINCPTNSYVIGGVGSLFDEEESRLSAKLAATQRVNAAGNHEIKAGIDFEDNRLSSPRQYSGGAFYQNFVGQFIQENRWVQLAAPTDMDPRFDQSCGPTGNPDGSEYRCDFLQPGDAASGVDGNTFNWAAYLRDSWQVLPNLTFNAGLRYEEQRLRYSKELQNTLDPLTNKDLGKNAMVLRNQWAPRIGLVYDWTKEGRSKVYTNWGRFYESIPMDINDRSFGGETAIIRFFDPAACGAANPNIGGAKGSDCVTNNAPEAQDPFLFGTGVLVAPGLKAQYLDEFLIGAEYEVIEDLKIGLSYQNRRLGRVLEDVSVDNADTYILANPGEFDSNEEKKLQDRIDGLPEGDGERIRLENELAQYQAIRIFDKPKRDYNAVTLTATKRFGRELFVQGSYTYSRTEGNYPGLFSADNGQVDPNISSQFDLIELLANRDGPLPQDRPHYFKLDGYYQWNLGKAGIFTPGVRVRALSGIPKNTLARHYLYGPDESFLLPRGELGRTDETISFDIRAQYSRDIGNGMKADFFIDAFNILNTQGTFSIDRTYTFQSANPIVGGEFRDLIWAKQLDGNGLETNSALSRNLNHGNTAGRYSPFRATLGARLSF